MVGRGRGSLKNTAKSNCSPPLTGGTKSLELRAKTISCGGGGGGGLGRLSNTQLNQSVEWGGGV